MWHYLEIRTLAKELLLGSPLVALVINAFTCDLTSVSLELFLVSWLITLVFTLFIWTSNAVITSYLQYRLYSISAFWKQVLVRLVAMLGVTTAVAIPIKLLLLSVLPERGQEGWQLIETMKISITAALIINTLYEARFFFRRWEESHREAEDLRRANLRSQYESLKNQVNPHFLFNALNTLSSLIDEEPETAKAYVQEMSSVYRYLLKSREEDLVTVEQEMGFIRAYVFLLQIRFGENLRTELEVNQAAQQQLIPPLSLQILVENAIKHNVVSSNKPLTIRVFEEEGCLVVKNNYQKKQVPVGSNRVGLYNLRTRYRLLSGRQIEVAQDALSFIVKLPLIQMETA